MGAVPSNPEMQPKAYLFKCRNTMKNNEEFVIKDLTRDNTYADLLERIGTIMHIPAAEVLLSGGFPPKELSFEASAKLSDTGFGPSEVLIVKQLARRAANSDQPASGNLSKGVRSSASAVTGHGDQATSAEEFMRANLAENVGFLVRRQVPANNSCLFTSINYLLNNETLDLRSASVLRDQVATVIKNDPQTYNEAFLGKKNDLYCTWIMQDESWGGGIEIAILCDLFQVEIDVIDVAAGRVTKFAEDRAYQKRMFLYYDQVHYDPVVFEYVDSQKRSACLFSTSEARILALAQELAEEARSMKDFTDVNRMALRCVICNEAFEQPRDAHIHADITGHTNFAETR